MSIERILDAYGDRLYRMCFVMLGNEADAEDAVQETLIRYFQKAPPFSDAEHEKAWLLRVAANQCRDILRLKTRHNHADVDSLSIAAPAAPDQQILEALMALPEKYRLVMMLHYVEEYRVEDIAKIIEKTPSAIKMRLQKGRKLLGDIYRREYL
ncbi:MAG: RNA polymerase sigma factor [Oscillospiraceae bacterium]|nr:RNA polymerase sigma factor [Oscillospiraceae bacterium]